jgi:four helix bundle protein
LKQNLAYDKAFVFSIDIVKLYKNLCNDYKEFTLSKQVLRSGTSIAANIKESIYAQSRKDFINKIYIALKEASETEYWLELLLATNYITENYFIAMHYQATELIKILSAIVKTTKENNE